MNLSDDSDYDADTDFEIPIPSSTQDNTDVGSDNLRLKGSKRGVEDLQSPPPSPNMKRFREDSESDSDSDATIDYEYTPDNKEIKRQLSDPPGVSPDRKKENLIKVTLKQLK